MCISLALKPNICTYKYIIINSYKIIYITHQNVMALINQINQTYVSKIGKKKKLPKNYTFNSKISRI